MTNKIKASSQTFIADAGFDPFVPLTSQSLFWRAHFLRPSPALEALPLVFWLTECLRPDLSVTLGLTDAVPYFAQCQAIEKLGLDGMCFGVELPVGGVTEELDDKTSAAEVQSHNNTHYAEISEILSGPHKEVAGLFDDATIDTLIINQFATRELLDDIDTYWLPRMSPRGVLLFLAGGEQLGPYIAQLSADGGSFSLDAKKQTCIALYGDQPNDRVRRLCQLRMGKPGYLAARNVFTRVGELHSNAVRIGELEQGGSASTPADSETIERLQAQLSEQTALAQQLTDQLKEKTAQVALAQSETFDSKATLEREQSQAKEQILALSQDLTRLQTLLDAAENGQKSRELAEQEKTEALKALIEAHKAASRDRTQAYNEELEKLSETVTSAQTACADAEERAKTLEQELKTAQDSAQNEVETLTAERQAAIARAETLEQELETAQSAARNSSEELTVAAQTLASRISDIESLGAALAEKETALDDARAALEVSTASTGELQSALDASKARTGELESALKTAQADVDRLSEELSTTNAARLEAETVMSDRLSDIASLGEALAEKESALGDAQAALDDSTARMDELESAIQKAQAEMQQLSEEASAAEARSAKAEKSLSQRLNDIEILGQELASKEIDLLQDRAKTVKLTDTLTRNTEEYNETLSALRAKLDGKERNLKEMQEQLRIAERERDEARHWASQLEASTSWRVTAPLRRASLMVRGEPNQAQDEDDDKR